MDNVYYVYAISDNSLQPFYVGIARARKGAPEGHRPKRHIREAEKYRDEGRLVRGANKLKLHKIIKSLAEDTLRISIIANHLVKDDAVAMEVALIKRYGRIDVGTGCLTNMTAGGEGTSEMSSETKARIAQAHLGKPKASKGGKKPPRTEEHCKNISTARRGQPAWNKGKPHPSKGVKRQPWTAEQRAKLTGPRPHMQGRSQPFKGKTYEEIHGPETAAEQKEQRRQELLKRWKEKGKM